MTIEEFCDVISHPQFRAISVTEDPRNARKRILVVILAGEGHETKTLGISYRIDGGYLERTSQARAAVRAIVLAFEEHVK